MPKRSKTNTNSKTLPLKQSRTSSDSASKGKSTKPDSQKSPNDKKEKPKLDPRLKPIKRIVEAQPTDAFQSILFSLAEKNLLSLMKIHKKEEEVAKFGGNEDFIPGSLNFKPKLMCVDSLKANKATMTAISEWNNKIT